MWQNSVGLVLNQVAACHFLRLLQSHDVQDGGSYVGQHAVGNLCLLVLRDVDEGHRIERVGRVGGAVGIDGIVALPWSAMMMVS